MRKICLFFSLFLFSFSLMAQHTLEGRVLSAQDKSAIERATIQLFSLSDTDSLFVDGCQSDTNGSFIFRNVANGRYFILITNIGYKQNKVPVRTNGSNVSIKPILLEEDVQALSEVRVTGHAAEMTVKGDTIEYNTAAYQVGENAMVEDLLKKMNGVTVDKDGNVTVNGETIKAVRIDGKKFFGNDVQSATKNIPADMIEKVQVIDEKSEFAKMTGFDDDEGEHIINLTLKKNRKKGVFGNYTGALGADMVTANGGWFDYGNKAYGIDANARAKHFFQDDFRYNANLFTNILLGESQTTIIAGANNTNEVRMGRGRQSFGSNANSGITWSESLGVNTNIDLNKFINPKDNKTNMLFGGDVAVNHTHNDTQTEQDKTEFVGDSTQYKSYNTSSKQTNAWDVNTRFELEYNIDSLNKIVIQPSLSYTSKSSIGEQDYTYWEDSTLLNEGTQVRLDSSRTMNAGIKATYNHKFSRPGRSLTIRGNYNYADTQGYNETHATGINSVDQHTFSTNYNHKYSLRVSYVEPIYANNHLLELVAEMSGNNRKSNKDQFSKDSLTNAYAYDSTYSNALENNYYTEQLDINYRWKSQLIDLTVGVRGIATQTHSSTAYGGLLVRDTTVYSLNFAPRVNFKYKFGKKQFARINYQGRTQQPSITQMEPVRNNSNAMNETVGNLGLKPSFAHNLQFMYSKFNQDRFSSIMAGIRGSVTQNALVNNSLYDETGKLYQQTVNAHTTPWNISGDLMYNTPFCNKAFQLNTRTTLSYNQRVAYIHRGHSATEIEQMISDRSLVLGTPSMTGNLRASEDLTLRFTHEIIDIGVRGNVVYSYTNNSLSNKSNSHVFDWGVTGDIAIHLPKSWNIYADCGYTARYGYQLSNVNELLLNASIEKTWSHTTLSLKAYDILHQKKNIVQVVSDNSISYAKYNTLPTYFMLTCTVKLNKMGDLQAKGKAGKMQEMIESGVGPFGGGMPPMPPQGAPMPPR